MPKFQIGQIVKLHGERGIIVSRVKGKFGYRYRVEMDNPLLDTVSAYENLIEVCSPHDRF